MCLRGREEKIEVILVLVLAAYIMQNLGGGGRPRGVAIVN